MKENFRESKVRQWMKNNLVDHRDRITGEINITSLAECAADAFGQAGRNSPLDDETHWIWDVAAEFFDQ